MSDTELGYTEMLNQLDDQTWPAAQPDHRFAHLSPDELASDLTKAEATLDYARDHEPNEKYLQVLAIANGLRDEHYRRLITSQTPSPLPTPTPTVPQQNAAEVQAAELRRQVSEYDTAIQAHTVRPELRQVVLEERAVALTRAQELEQLAPFVRQTDDDLNAALEDAHIAFEEARVARKDLQGVPESRGAARKQQKAQRTYESASAQVDAISAEIKRRGTIEVIGFPVDRGAWAEHIERRTRNRAEQDLREARDKALDGPLAEARKRYGVDSFQYQEMAIETGKAKRQPISEDAIVARTQAINAQLRERSEKDLRMSLVHGSITYASKDEPFQRRDR